MAYEETIRGIYNDFAAFGANRGASMPMMDGPKFAKFAKDCKLLDKTNLTATDVDLIFAKAKSKTERRITVDQFYTAVCMMADKKYPEEAGDAALEKLMGKISNSQGPKATATVADSSGIYGKLTDTSLYTGSHKERFNEDGTGRGMDGRDRIAKGKGSSKGAITSTGSGDDSSPPISDDEESNEYLAGEVAKLGVSPPKPKAPSSSPSKPATLSKSGAGAKSSPTLTKSPSGGGIQKSTSSPSKSPSSPSKSPTKPSIFDKLTDSSQYTGSHKNRFNADGTGRGLAGRDSVRKGGVSGQDLSQMVRRS